MNKEDLRPGCVIPARIITCLQESVTKRSDVYIADTWLKSLEKDYCVDLVKDSSDTLIWLEKINNTAKTSRRHYCPFTFDFESLYDSLGRNLIFMALQDAMDKCRPEWNVGFKSWLRDLVQLSIDSAIGEYRGTFYKPKGGCPTGGSLSVQIANISVFYVLNKVLYQDKSLMKDVVDIKRFIDDGAGLHQMTPKSFNVWKNVVSKRVAVYGLTIKDVDWSEPKKKHDMINFLDINFSFDKKKTLQTDLYRKPTDARSYLHFDSCHPPHCFSGVVTSQAIRLRRIINDDHRLTLQLEELKKDFLKCGYPLRMLDNILNKVNAQERSLAKKEKNAEDPDNCIRVISTHGRDDRLVNILKSAEKISKKISFKYVKRTAPSLHNILVKPKSTCLGNSRGKTSRCKRGTMGKRGKKCRACGLMSGKDKIKGHHKNKYLTAEGSCISKNLIYHATCKHCQKVYVGKTTQMLSNRINGHRNKFQECRKKSKSKIKFNDDHLLGLHVLYQHGLQSPNAFDEAYDFTILDTCHPKDLDRKEHEWVQKLKCVTPYGLNAQDPFGIPLVM